MPDYSKSLIYKLCCKDASITDEYIGSTTNKTKRKACHKYCCNNKNDEKYNLIIYQFIREHGGFENWDLIILEEYPCENKRQLEIKEREWIELRKPTLNIKMPIRTDEDNKNFELSNERIKYKKEYRIKNKEYHKEYQQKNKEKNKKYYKQYRQQKKIKNKSAVIIQQFFKKYFLKK